jgi:hypothetical protein
VIIAGHAVNTVANGCWVATVTSATAFTIPVAGIGVGTATGTVTKQPTDALIQSTVNGVWNDIAGITATD